MGNVIFTRRFGVEVFKPVDATGGTITTRTINGVDYKVHTFNYTGADQTFTINDKGTDNEIFVKLFGAAGGGRSSVGGGYPTGFGGAGGFGLAKLNVKNLSNDLKIVVGQGGRAATTSGTIASTYGHFGLYAGNRPGGWGSCSGWGGGLTGVFNNNSITQENSLLIVGGGGGGGVVGDSNSGPQGGPGGGLNENGLMGNPLNPSNRTRAQGRGGTLNAGGISGISVYVSPNGVASSSVATGGAALRGGHGHTTCSWTEGGGGGSGYFGGGSGAHGQPAYYWEPGGGGSGYANNSFATIITSITSNYSGLNSTVSSDIDWSSGISTSNLGTAQAGNGKIVIYYPLTKTN
jgi:hypothetical protein